MNAIVFKLRFLFLFGVNQVEIWKWIFSGKLLAVRFGAWASELARDRLGHRNLNTTSCIFDNLQICYSVTFTNLLGVVHGSDSTCRFEASGPCWATIALRRPHNRVFRGGIHFLMAPSRSCSVPTTYTRFWPRVTAVYTCCQFWAMLFLRIYTIVSASEPCSEEKTSY